LRVKDLYLDEVVLRKVKRAAEAARRGVDDTSDIEPEENDDSSMIVGKSTNIKKERDRSRRRMEEIDADDD
jgi:E3 SUMO-protein ligase NSE2